MFIELTEHLRCPQDHAEVHCVLATVTMKGRDVLQGTLGCPECRREYLIRDGAVHFGGAPVPVDHPSPAPDAGTVQALLGLMSPGGFVALVGSAARFSGPLSELIGEVHFVAIDPPPDVQPDASLSLLFSEGMIPLRTSVMRGVVLGGEYARDPWLADAGRVVLPGLRVLVLAEQEAPGLERLAAGSGMWVGQKATMGSTTRRGAG